jgi:ATP-binding cassette subfamily A (ABC1) protein 3
MISLLTGLFPPTSGDALIYGKSIVNEPSEARASLGICPQQNILFERLTVLEHIRFFQRIKGLSPDSSNVKHNAEEAGLEEFFHTTAAALSGGNKRKLCVAIALSGNPVSIYQPAIFALFIIVSHSR